MKRTLFNSTPVLAVTVTVSEGVYMYQITEKGLMVGMGITGAKYSKDKVRSDP